MPRLPDGYNWFYFSLPERKLGRNWDRAPPWGGTLQQPSCWRLEPRSWSCPTGTELC